MATVTISQKNQVVVPKDVRKTLRIGAGSKISLVPLDARRALLIAQPKDKVAALKGLGKHVWRRLGGAEKYLKAERSAWK